MLASSAPQHLNIELQGSQRRVSLIGVKDRMGHDGANTLLSYAHVQVDRMTDLLSMIASDGYTANI